MFSISSSSVQSVSHVWLFATLWTAHVKLPCPSPTPGACLKLMSIESVMSSNHHIHYCPLSSCLQSFPASGSFLKIQFFSSDGQSIGASASASVLPMTFQDLFPLGLTRLITLLSKRLSRVFFSTTTQKHQFFSAQLALWYNSHIHTWLLEKT